MKKVLICALALLMSVSVLAREQATHTISTSGTSVTFPDISGTKSNTFEELITGSPSVMSIVVKGCMRGGTCSTIDTYSGTTSTIRIVSGGPYDNFLVTATWTGSSITVIINRTASLN